MSNRIGHIPPSISDPNAVAYRIPLNRHQEEMIKDLMHKFVGKFNNKVIIVPTKEREITRNKTYSIELIAYINQLRPYQLVINIEILHNIDERKRTGRTNYFSKPEMKEFRKYGFRFVGQGKSTNWIRLKPGLFGTSSELGFYLYDDAVFNITSGELKQKEDSSGYEVKCEFKKLEDTDIVEVDSFENDCKRFEKERKMSRLVSRMCR